MKNWKNESDPRPNAAGLRPSSANRAGAATRGLLVFMIALGIVAAPSLSMARDSAEVVGKEGGLGAAAALSSLVYAPAKLLYATGGLVVGAFAWAFTAGDTEVASAVFTRSLKGTYVITPGMLTGDETVEFIGREESEAYAPVGAVASASQASQTYTYTTDAAVDGVQTGQRYTSDGYLIEGTTETATSDYTTGTTAGSTYGAPQVYTAPAPASTTSYGEAQPTYDDLGW